MSGTGPVVWLEVNDATSGETEIVLVYQQEPRCGERVNRVLGSVSHPVAKIPEPRDRLIGRSVDKLDSQRYLALHRSCRK